MGSFTEQCGEITLQCDVLHSKGLVQGAIDADVPSPIYDRRLACKNSIHGNVRGKGLLEEAWDVKTGL